MEYTFSRRNPDNWISYSAEDYRGTTIETLIISGVEFTLFNGDARKLQDALIRRHAYTRTSNDSVFMLSWDADGVVFTAMDFSKRMPPDFTSARIENDDADAFARMLSSRLALLA